MAQKYSLAEVAQILQNAGAVDQASIARGNAGGAQSIRVVRIDLTNERTESTALKIGFPFLSLYVQGASDSEAFVQFKPDTKDEYQGKVTLRRKDSLNFGLSKSDAFFIHPAQAGKFIEIVFFVDAQFTSGSQLIDSSTVTDNFNLNGTGEQSNNFPMVHLFGGVGLSSNTTPNQFIMARMTASNSPNIEIDNGFGLVNYFYKVPQGFELVVNHFKTLTRTAIAGSTPIPIFEMGALLDSLNGNSNTTFGWDTAANIMKRVSVGSTRIPLTLNDEIQRVNGFASTIASIPDPFYTTDGRLTFQAGSELVAGVRLQAGTITAGNVFFEISGFLREVA